MDTEQDEVHCVNKLLAIEDLDWARQLKQAVSFVSLTTTPPPFFQSGVYRFDKLSLLRLLFPCLRVLKIEASRSGRPAAFNSVMCGAPVISSPEKSSIRDFWKMSWSRLITSWIIWSVSLFTCCFGCWLVQIFRNMSYFICHKSSRQIVWSKLCFLTGGGVCAH